MALKLLLLSTTAAASAQSVRDEYDCLMRNFAVEYAAFIQPFRALSVFSDVADALNGTPEKAVGCNVSSAHVTATATSRFPLLHAPSTAPSAGGQTFYVSTAGSDAAGDGSAGAPFASITRAVAAARASPGFDTILLRGGTYYGQPTVVLTPEDEGLTIQNAPGEEVWLSGSLPLPKGGGWKAYNVSNSTPPAPTPQWNVVFNQNDVFANANGAKLLKTTPTWQECQALCQGTAGCTAWAWHDKDQGSYAFDCFSATAWAPTPQTGHISGYYGAAPPLAPKNVWALDLSGSGVGAIVGLRAPGGARLTRARFPNGFPETKGFMPPAVFRAAWTPQQLPRAPATQIDLPPSALDRNTSVSSFQTFTAGIGGTCDRFQPNAGYWCSKNVQGGGSVIYYVPIAMQASQSTLPNTPYKSPAGAIVQTWRPGHWASWMYEVGSATFDAASGVTNFTFSAGGFQGSRGENSGEDTYIDNIFEELDAPSEWFFDAATSTLYLFFNATPGTPPPADGSILFTPPANKHLFNITGTMAAPVRGVSLLGLGLRDTAYTYMDPHGIPSGGDWTLERSAVVLLEGTEQVTVRGCVFERVDGNAVLLSAYNRNASITMNEFAWIGATAVALWGNTEATAGADSALPEGYGADGTSGNQPRHNVVAYNLCRELGVWEKQSSCYTQFKSGFNTVYRVRRNPQQRTPPTAACTPNAQPRNATVNRTSSTTARARTSSAYFASGPRTISCAQGSRRPGAFHPCGLPFTTPPPPPPPFLQR
jgi:hypothetical protein